MTTDPDSPCILLSVANEIEAGSIVTALAAYDIEASTTGGFITPDVFVAGMTSRIQILVRQSDLDRAQAALDEIREDQGKIDWSTVDVGEPED